MKVSTVLFLGSLRTVVSARGKNESSSELEHKHPDLDHTNSTCKLFDLEDVFAEGVSPVRIEVRYSCDEEPITFVETTHEKENRLLLWTGQGADSEDDVISVHVASNKKDDLKQISGILRVNDMTFRYLTSSDGTIGVSKHGEDFSEPKETEDKDKGTRTSSEKEDTSNKNDIVKVKDETDLVLCEGSLEVEAKRLQSALQRSEEKMGRLRYELSECYTTKSVKSEKVGRSTKSPKGRSTKSPKKTSTTVKKQKKSSLETALESQNTILKHALKALREVRREDKKKVDQIGFIQQVMAFVFNARKVEGAPK